MLRGSGDVGEGGEHGEDDVHAAAGEVDEGLIVAIRDGAAWHSVLCGVGTRSRIGTRRRLCCRRNSAGGRLGKLLRYRLQICSRNRGQTARPGDAHLGTTTSRSAPNDPLARRLRNPGQAPLTVRNSTRSHTSKSFIPDGCGRVAPRRSDPGRRRRQRS